MPVPEKDGSLIAIITQVDLPNMVSNIFQSIGRYIYLFAVFFVLSLLLDLVSRQPRVGSGVVRINPLRFLTST